MSNEYVEKISNYLFPTYDKPKPTYNTKKRKLGFNFNDNIDITKILELYNNNTIIFPVLNYLRKSLERCFTLDNSTHILIQNFQLYCNKKELEELFGKNFKKTTYLSYLKYLSELNKKYLKWINEIDSCSEYFINKNEKLYNAQFENVNSNFCQNFLIVSRDPRQILHDAFPPEVAKYYKHSLLNNNNNFSKNINSNLYLLQLNKRVKLLVINCKNIIALKTNNFEIINLLDLIFPIENNKITYIYEENNIWILLEYLSDKLNYDGFVFDNSIVINSGCFTNPIKKYTWTSEIIFKILQGFNKIQKFTKENIENEIHDFLHSYSYLIDLSKVAEQKVEVEDNCKNLNGLKNDRNSCYMDSVLFALFSTHTNFIENIFNHKIKKEQYEKCSINIREGILEELKKIYFNMRNSKKIQLQKKLRELLSQCNFGGINYNDGQPQDSQEFLDNILSLFYKNDAIFLRQTFVKNENSNKWIETNKIKNYNITIIKPIHIWNESEITLSNKIKEIEIINLDKQNPYIWNKKKWFNKKTIDSLLYAPYLVFNIFRAQLNDLQQFFNINEDLQRMSQVIINPDISISLCKGQQFYLQAIVLLDRMKLSNGSFYAHYTVVFKCNNKWYHYNDMHVTESNNGIELIGNTYEIMLSWNNNFVQTNGIQYYYIPDNKNISKKEVIKKYNLDKI
tara:strand:- start:94 stop:2133 length:2040 start_codon:yes stop_codon:yes gene_type:complete